MAIAAYTASEEGDFMIGLLNAKKYEQALQYTTLVLSGTRRWDDSVDVGAVMITARRVQSLASLALRNGGLEPNIMGAL